MFYLEYVIILPFLFRTCCKPDCLQLYLRCTGSCRAKAEDKMMASMRKKDEEQAINLKFVSGVLTMIWVYHYCSHHVCVTENH